MFELYIVDLPDFPPDPPEPKPCCKCASCADEIYDGRQRMYRVNGDLLCKDCFVFEVMDPRYVRDVTDPEALADLLEIDTLYADDAEAEEEE